MLPLLSRVGWAELADGLQQGLRQQFFFALPLLHSAAGRAVRGPRAFRR